MLYVFVLDNEGGLRYEDVLVKRCISHEDLVTYIYIYTSLSSIALVFFVPVFWIFCDFFFFFFFYVKPTLVDPIDAKLFSWDCTASPWVKLRNTLCQELSWAIYFMVGCDTFCVKINRYNKSLF